jgi:WD40 repeat protein
VDLDNPSRRFQLSVTDQVTLRRIAGQTTLPGNAIPYAVAHNPTSDQIAVGCESVGGANGAVFVGASAADGSLNLTLVGVHAYDVNSVVFSRDGQFLFTGGAINPHTNAAAEIIRWELPNHTVTHRISCSSSVNALAVSADGRHVAAGCADGTVRLLSAENLESSRDAQFPAGAHITALAFAPDGLRLACGTSKGRIAVLRIEGTKLTLDSEPKCTVARLTGLRFGPDSSVLYFSTGATDAGIGAWNLGIGRLVRPNIPVPGVVLDFDFATATSALIALTTEGGLTTIPMPAER